MILLTIALAGAFLLSRPRAQLWSSPTPLGKAEAFPDTIRRSGGAWYWIERPKDKPASLIRATAGNRTVVATGAEVTGLRVTDDALLWTVRSGATWSVVRAGLDGKSPQTLWSGLDRPMGPCGVKDTIYWLRATAARVPGGSPFPPLGGGLEVVALKAGAAAPAPVTRLADTGEGAVLGAQGDSLVLAVLRLDNPGSTSLYKLSLAGGTATRLYSAPGRTVPMLTRDGRLYELSPSEEAASPADSFQLVEVVEGHAQLVADWLPLDGALYETTRGLIYGDLGAPPGVWRLHGPGAMPEQLEPPDGYQAVAAGEGQLLLISARDQRAVPTLYEVPLP